MLLLLLLLLHNRKQRLQLGTIPCVLLLLLLGCYCCWFGVKLPR